MNHSYNQRVRQSGFIMMFTLVAVALTGLVMVETAPDFSNYAVLAKADEFDRNLSSLRHLMSTDPFGLTTFDSYSPLDTTTGVLTEDDLNNALEEYVVADGSTVRATRTIISTVPKDPYVPYREWLSNTPQSKFWASSYNFVSNPSFYTGTRQESYLDDSIGVYFVGITGGQSKIYGSDRFGRNIKTVCYQGSSTTIKDCTLSPDGTVIAFSSNYFNDGTKAGTNFDVFVAGTNTFIPRPVTDHRRSIVAGVSHSHSKPTWTGDGALLAITVSEIDAADTVLKADILLSQPLKDDPAYPYSDGASVITTGTHSMTDFHCAWSPIGNDETYPGRSRYLLYCATDSGASRLGLYDRKTKRFIFDRTGGSSSTVFLGQDNFPCDDHTPSFGSNDAEILYVRNADRDLYILEEPAKYGSPLCTTDDTGITNVDNFQVIPKSADLASRSNWILYKDQTDNRLYRTYFKPLTPNPKPVFDTTFSTVQDGKNGYNLSERGSLLATVGPASSTVRIYSVDGSLKGEQKVTLDGGVIEEVFFSKVKSPWVGPAPEEYTHSYPNVKLVSPEKSDTAQYVEPDVWRNFISDNKEYANDHSLGNSWLRLHPAQNEDQLLFDDSYNVWRVSAENPSVLPDTDREFIPLKIDPTWSYLGTTFIGKEAKDPTGGEPADLFKLAFKTATTLIAGNGYTPDMSPDDNEYCYSQTPSELSTYPGDSTTYPIDDVDLWVTNSGGASEPPPRNITPDTPRSYEHEPCYSPDGRHIYFTREKQHYGEYLPNHESTIARITPYGGSLSIVIEGGNIEPEWAESKWDSQIECYHPSVSPDGTRVAFVAKERIIGQGSIATMDGSYEIGDIITECLYVKDVLLNRDPVLLLRIGSSSTDFDISTLYRAQNNSASVIKDCSIDSLTWSPDGEEIYACLTHPMNRKFPKRIKERGSTNSAHTAEEKTPYYDSSDEQIVVAVPVSISHFVVGTNAREFTSGNLDPPGYYHGSDDFRLIAQNKTGGTITSGDTTKVPPWGNGYGIVANKIFNIALSKSAYCFQRIETDSPFFDSEGVNLGIWYILSGYVRTSMDIEALSSAQMMMQLFNSKGTLVALIPVSDGMGKIYQIGYPDLGGTQWTRFSAAVNFIPDGIIHDKDLAPYYINLMLYTTGSPGSWAEFTGLKLEKAYDEQTVRPTKFAPGWLLFSPSLNPDPRRPGHLLYER